MELASLKIKKLIILSNLSPHSFSLKSFLYFFLIRTPSKRNSYIFSKKSFLYFGKWNFLIFPEMGLLSLKNKKFQEETFPSYLLAAQASSFLIHRFLQTKSVRPHLVASSLTV